jgi:hypothetical protein
MISVPYLWFLGGCALTLGYLILRSYAHECESLADLFDEPSHRLASFWYTVLSILPVGVVVCFAVSAFLYFLGGK